MNLGNCMAPLPGLIRIGRVSSALALPAERLHGLGLDAYDVTRDAEAPALFMGLYNADDLHALQTHRGPIVQMFCGGDARNGRWAAPALATMRPRVRVLATPTLLVDLHRAEIEVDVVHGVYAGDAGLFGLRPMPAPTDPYVYAYIPYERRAEYGIAMLTEIAARLPDVYFWLGRWGTAAPPFRNCVALPAWVAPSDMPSLYSRCFCGVRTILRDGFPGTPVELALMGRPVAGILDYGVPWIECAPTVDAMVAFVERARQRTEPDFDVARAARMHVEDRSFLRLP